MSTRALRFARSLVAAATLAGCSSSTTAGDAAQDAVADAVSEAAAGDGATPTCPVPRPLDLTPCTNPGYECVVPPDPTPPDAMALPSGGSCRCDGTGGTPVWRCFLAAGPLAPPEL